jgi:hypothetical protein
MAFAGENTRLDASAAVIDGYRGRAAAVPASPNDLRRVP